MKFQVTVTALAEVEQVAEIEADNAGKAEQIALDTVGDRIWKYQGIQETVSVVAWPATK